MSKQKINDVRNEILSLLDDKITKKEIIDRVGKEYDIAKSDVRKIMKEIRIDFLNKVKILQSGVVGI